MAIKLNVEVFGLEANSIVRNISYDIERRLVALNAATYDLSGGVELTEEQAKLLVSDFERRFIQTQDLSNSREGYFNPFEPYSTGWRDSRAWLASSLPVPGQGSNPTLELWKGLIASQSFAAGAKQSLIVNPFHIDHDYKPGTPLHFHAHWAPSTTASGVVRFEFEYVIAKGHGQEVFGSPQTLAIEVNASGVVDQHEITEDLTGILDGGLLEPDALVIGTFSRNGAHANDTYPDKIWGFMFDAHYQTDRSATPNKAPNFYGD